jgi:hypothetical protein
MDIKLHVFEPDADTPSQRDFICRLASLPHTMDDGPATVLEMGGALGYLNDAIQVAREIVKRDNLKPLTDRDRHPGDPPRTDKPMGHC